MRSSQTENPSSAIASGKAVTLGQQAPGEQPSVSVNLLCEFLTNPFGNVQRARELLSQIEGRSLTDAELERGQFCFQIAFLFLACLAITAHMENSIIQKSCINRLYDRVRGFYARTGSTAKFSDVVVSASERDQFVAGLRELLEKTDEEHGDISRVTMTKLGLFDLVGLRRLCEYHGAMGPPDFRHAFYLVAEQLLLHYGGKKYHPALVAMIADLLSANYNILSKIVVSGLCAVNPRRTEHEETFESMPLGPSMPDLTKTRPSRIYLAGEYLLLLVEDVAPIGAGGGMWFRYVLAACDRRRKRPVCFVTLENSSSISNVLCVFEPNGSHSNYGALRGRNVLQEFMAKGMHLIGQRVELGEIEELSPHQQQQPPPPQRQQQSWWKLIPIAPRKRFEGPRAAGGGKRRNETSPRDSITSPSVRVSSPKLAPAISRQILRGSLRV